jgi:hypothetical protein
MPMDLSTNLNPKESKVEATLMGATLNLLSQSGALVIVLNENQAIDLRAQGWSDFVNLNPIL